MRDVVLGLDQVTTADSVVGVGFFDGVHRGHQSLIERVLDEGKKRGVRTAIMTFDRHPKAVVNPSEQPKLLMSRDRRLTTLAETGVDLVVALPFVDDLRRLSPSQFIEHVLCGPIAAKHVVVGDNFRFGHRAVGDIDVLTKIGAVSGFTAEAVSLVTHHDVVVSSTQIRNAIADGDVERAAKMLGRPHVLDGLVVRGNQRGREMGYPTANLDVPEGAAVPADGIYAGRFAASASDRAVDQETTWYPAAISIGTNPTFAGVDERRVEAFVLDFDGDLYGERASVSFRHRLRSMERFDNVEDLTAAIDQDVAETRRLLEG